MNKFPPHSKFHAQQAFTLIELLVVITIIGILAGVLLSAFPAVMDSVRKSSAKNDELQIITAVKAYYAEYGKYPVIQSGSDAYYGAPGSTAPALTFDNGGTSGNSALIDILRDNISATANAANLPNTKLLNPRQIVYLDPPTAKNATKPVSGVVQNGVTLAGVWYDPWGSPYCVIMDGNYDNSLNNPYFATDAAAPGGQTLTTGVIVYSYGKNGKLGGGAAAGAGFSKESGAVGVFKNSGDVISWQ